MTSLHQSRKRYINAIKVVDSGKAEGTVMLDYSKDKLIKMLEEGCGPFDMKVGMLASPKVKTGKNGVKYLTIPFRLGTPGSVGESDVFTTKMPAPIHDVVKKKPLTINTSGGGKRSVGLSLKEIPAEFQVKKKTKGFTNKETNKEFAAYQHKSSIFEGVHKQQDSVTQQNSYRSFRRVSENSSPEAFIHPGIERHALIQKALQNFNTDKEAMLLMDNELEKLGLIEK